ncbi:MAG TPA: hypothetical protein PK390_04125 [Fervidobacterium nodosum]|nr:hypothetical protein [Fervidobacterium nodosum]
MISRLEIPLAGSTADLHVNLRGAKRVYVESCPNNVYVKFHDPTASTMKLKENMIIKSSYGIKQIFLTYTGSQSDKVVFILYDNLFIEIEV